MHPGTGKRPQELPSGFEMFDLCKTPLIGNLESHHLRTRVGKIANREERSESGRRSGSESGD